MPDQITGVVVRDKFPLLSHLKSLAGAGVGIHYRDTPSEDIQQRAQNTL